MKTRHLLFGVLVAGASVAVPAAAWATGLHHPHVPPCVEGPHGGIHHGLLGHKDDQDEHGDDACEHEKPHGTTPSSTESTTTTTTAKATTTTTAKTATTGAVKSNAATAVKASPGFTG